MEFTKIQRKITILYFWHNDPISKKNAISDFMNVTDLDLWLVRNPNVDGRIDGWMDDLQFYVLFNSISVISGWCEDDNERLCATVYGWKISARAEFEFGTAWSAGQRLIHYPAVAPLILNRYTFSLKSFPFPKSAITITY